MRFPRQFLFQAINPVLTCPSQTLPHHRSTSPCPPVLAANTTTLPSPNLRIRNSANNNSSNKQKRLSIRSTTSKSTISKNTTNIRRITRHHKKVAPLLLQENLLLLETQPPLEMTMIADHQVFSSSFQLHIV